MAILSAVESVSPAIPSTLDAAALCKMVDRGQITGAIVDGPLAFDNAISSDAARIKKIKSQVAGDPDLLMVPNLEAGNILFKELQYLAERWRPSCGGSQGSCSSHRTRGRRTGSNGKLRPRRPAGEPGARFGSLTHSSFCCIALAMPSSCDFLPAAPGKRFCLLGAINLEPCTMPTRAI